MPVYRLSGGRGSSGSRSKSAGVQALGIGTNARGGCEKSKQSLAAELARASLAARRGKPELVLDEPQMLPCS